MKDVTVEFKMWLISYLIVPFSWSKWTDISVFTFGHDGYLLQGKVNRISNAKRFRITEQKQSLKSAHSYASFDRLKEVGLIDEQVTFNNQKQTENE